jgi:hypothetical protein
LRENVVTRARRIDLVFAAACLVLSLQALPYRIDFCLPPALRGDNSPEAIAAGTAGTPYQYRALIPWMVRAAVETRVVALEDERTLFAVVEGLALLSIGVVFRRLVSIFIQGDVLTAVVALTVYAVLPFNYFNGPFFPYDTPSVLFFMVGLILIHQEQWRWFYPMFALATVNRETSIFLVVVTVLVLAGRYGGRVLAAMAGAQLAIWAVIKIALWLLYYDNRGVAFSLFDYQLRVNAFTVLEAPIKSLATLATWGCAWIWVLLWLSHIRDDFLRRALWVVPVFVAGMLVVGFLPEIRIYGEMIPLILVAFWVAFLDVIKEARGRRETGWASART